MDLNEIMHFLKRAVSFKMRDAGTVTWASERPAPRAPRRAPGIDRLRLFRGPRELWGARARRTGKPRRSCGPFFPLRPVSLPSAFASQMLPRASTCLSGGRAPPGAATRASGGRLRRRTLGTPPSPPPRPPGRVRPAARGESLRSAPCRPAPRASESGASAPGG